MTESTISSIEPGLVLPLFGARDQHLRRLRDQFKVEITHRDGQVRIQGENDAVNRASEAIERLAGIVRRRGHLTPEVCDEVIGQVTGQSSSAPSPQQATIPGGPATSTSTWRALNDRSGRRTRSSVVSAPAPTSSSHHAVEDDQNHSEPGRRTPGRWC